MSDDDQSPPTQPKPGPPYRNPGAAALDGWCRTWNSALATTPPGVAYEPIRPGTRVSFRTTLPKPGERKVVEHARLITTTYPGDEVSMADLASPSGEAPPFRSRHLSPHPGR